MTLDPFLHPQGVVLIGASQDSSKLGFAVARNLIDSGYPGAVHFVNPKGGELYGRQLYRSIADVPDPLDLAVVLIPAPFVPQTLEECGQRGLRAAIILSGGFRETGAEGAALEAACLSAARKHGMRLLGPNCVGLEDTHLPIDATFLTRPGVIRGDVALLSHSGAFCEVVIDWAWAQGFGLSKLISLGNQVDVTETDFIAPLQADPTTKVITFYLEGIRDGRRFVEEASKVVPVKPLIALKVGRFASGRRAAASHTGAMAGEDRSYDAAFRKAGVIRANTSEEMFEWARCLAWNPLPRGRRVAVLTNAGGPGVTASDAIEANGLSLASLSSETASALRSLLPPAASVHNPVDMLATATPEQYADCLKLLAADPGVDMLLVILPPPPVSTSEAFAAALLEVIPGLDKPVAGALMGGDQICQAVNLFRKARVPEYSFPERAASALAVLARRAEFIQHISHLDEHDTIFESGCQGTVRSLLDQEANAHGEWLAPGTTRLILEAYGIPFLPEGLARTPAEAASIASQVGFPVALKIVSPDLPHKSDVGGVVLGVKDPADAEAAYQKMIEGIRMQRPEAQVVGVQVQRMASSGQEVIVGTVRDPQFGPLVMFGSGGVEVEGLNDVSFALAPVTRNEASRMLEETWAGRKLKGYRNLPPADREAVIDAITRLSKLALDFHEINEMEMNPLRVMQDGAFALDVRLKLA
jgi:acetyltransferase